MRLLYLLLFSLLLTAPLLAQRSSPPRGQAKGMVIDSTTGNPLREASVSLLAARDSSYLSFNITDGEGNFTLPNLAEGAYRLLITYVGYQNRTQPFTISAASPVHDFGKLKLQAQATTLNEVTVQQERAPITINADTLEFNAGSFKTKPNAAVEDLLKKLPGVEVSRDGTIRAQGQQVNRVLVDGKPFFGDDPKMATRNLPADIIDKVQLYDQQSDQAAFSGIDDGNREKTINITTKRDKRKGYFGRNTAGVGSDGRYTGQLNLNRFNNGRQISVVGTGNNTNQQGFTPGGGSSGFGGGGFSGAGGAPAFMSAGGAGNFASTGNTTPSNITESLGGGLNFKDGIGKRAEVSASYFVNRTTVTTDQQSRRETILPDALFINDQASYSRNRTMNHRLNARFDWNIDSLTSLRFTPSLSWTNSQLNNLNQQRSENRAGQPINRNQTRYSSTGAGINGFSNLLLMRKFRREGRTFSANLNTLLNNQDSRALNRATNEFFDQADTTQRITQLNQQNEQDNCLLNNALTLSYTEPLSLSKKLEARYSYTNNQNRSDRDVADFNEVTGQYDLVNARLSNQFTNTFNTHRAGLTLQNRRLRYTYGLGFDVQQASLRADNRSVDTVLTRQFTNLLPNATFSYNWSRSRTLRLNYRTRINAPSATQLQPVVDNTNPLSIRLGNPTLQPEYYNSLAMTFNTYNAITSQSFFAMVNVNQVSDRIVNTTTISNAGVQTTQPVNANGYYSVTSFLSFGRSIKPLKLNVNLRTNANLNRGVSFVNQQANYSQNWTLGQGLGINSNFNGKLEFNLAGNLSYQTARYSLQPSQNTQFFNKTLDIDIFYQLPFHFNLTSDFLYNNNTGRSAGYNQNFVLWNVGIARQFFKNKQGEVRLQVFDLLNQNRSITRNVTETYVEDVQSRVLRRYFMVSFMYNLRKFGI